MSGRRHAPFTSEERALLALLQRQFPLAPRPFAELARRLGREETAVIQAVAQWQESGVIRYLGPIFEPLAMGYHSALCAWRLPPSQIAAAARRLHAQTGVTHNYLRDHEFNCWFTLTAPQSQSLPEQLARLCREIGGETLYLPAQRVFKIGVVLPLGEESGRWDGERPGPAQRPLSLSEEDRAAVRAVQAGLPAVAAPYQECAEAMGLSEAALLRALQKIEAAGGLRRNGAVLRPTRAGFPVNAMIVWNVPEREVEAAGRFLAQAKLVTHCYERARAPQWPFNLYAMAHFADEAGLREWVARMQGRPGLAEPAVLRTLQELKKSRMHYFLENLPPPPEQG